MDSKDRGCVGLLRGRRIHLCHLQMYTRTHTSICKALIPPPALPEPLVHQGKKINSKTKRQSLASTQGARAKILTNQKKQNLCSP